MAKKHFWKYVLVPNKMTESVANDYIVNVSTVDHTLHNEDAAEVIASKLNLDKDLVLSVLNNSDDYDRDCILRGLSRQNRNLRLSPRILGGTSADVHHLDPTKHKSAFTATPTAEFRKALDEEVGWELAGIKDDGGAYIDLVTDVKTGKIDGTVSPNGVIVITGQKIKIDPQDATDVFISFTQQGTTTVLKVATIVDNGPKRITCVAPNLATGKIYTLRIVTRYSGGGKGKFLKTPRTIEYKLPIKTQATVDDCSTERMDDVQPLG
jgi:hypothetical protein